MRMPVRCFPFVGELVDNVGVMLVGVNCLSQSNRLENIDVPENIGILNIQHFYLFQI